MQGQAAADDAWQRRMRDAILVPELYERNYRGRYEFLAHDDPRASGGVDTLISGTVKIDEKIVRLPKPPRTIPYSAYALETMSCTVPGHERLGWMLTNKVDFLLYCFSDKEESALQCHAIDFPKLQLWFLRIADSGTAWPSWCSDQINKTVCRIVPFEEVMRNVPVKIFTRVCPGESRPMDDVMKGLPMVVK